MKKQNQIIIKSNDESTEYKLVGNPLCLGNMASNIISGLVNGITKEAKEKDEENAINLQYAIVGAAINELDIDIDDFCNTYKKVYNKEITEDDSDDDSNDSGSNLKDLFDKLSKLLGGKDGVKKTDKR